jgi:hypothetical protein
VLQPVKTQVSHIGCFGIADNGKHAAFVAKTIPIKKCHLLTLAPPAMWHNWVRYKLDLSARKQTASQNY